MYVMSRHKILIADFADFIFLYTNIFFSCIILVCVSYDFVAILPHHWTVKCSATTNGTRPVTGFLTIVIATEL